MLCDGLEGWDIWLEGQGIYVSVQFSSVNPCCHKTETIQHCKAFVLQLKKMEKKTLKILI